MDELIEKQFKMIKRILEPLIKNKQARDKLLRETQIRQEEIKNFTEKQQLPKCFLFPILNSFF